MSGMIASSPKFLYSRIRCASSTLLETSKRQFDKGATMTMLDCRGLSPSSDETVCHGARRRGHRYGRAKRFSTLLLSVGVVGALCGVVLQPSAAEAAPSQWTVTPVPHGDGATNLAGVSCTSPTFCAAVGSLGEAGTLVELWNGHTWSVSASPSPGGDPDELFGVSCVSSAFCVAVGWYNDKPASSERALVEMWDGRHWSVSHSPSPGVESALFSVSCASARTCEAVGYHDSKAGSVTLVEPWNGKDWSIAKSPDKDGRDSVLQSISCPSSKTCVAVGRYKGSSGQLTLVEAWNGKAWSIVSSPDPGTGNNGLMGVSCSRTARCQAVGSYSIGSGPSRTLVESWTGRSWTHVTSPNDGELANTLEDASCTSPSSCTAVGFYKSGSRDYRTLIEAWNGFDWSVTPSPSPYASDQLIGTTCIDTTVCEAVGYQGDRSVHSEKPLVETGSPPTITKIRFQGSERDPTVVVIGTGFGSVPPSLHANCGATGRNFPKHVLYLRDVTKDWDAGITGNCVGLKIETYTNTMIKFKFGNYYDTSPYFYALATGDQFSFEVKGTVATGTVAYT
jgi:hypothetical protein